MILVCGSPTSLGNLSYALLRIFMVAFELFRKKEQLRFAVQNFIEDPELEELVKEYANLSKKSVAMSIDRDAFSPEDIKTTRDRLNQIEEQHAERLRQYLKQYVGLTRPGSDDWHRWFAAKGLKE